jgi:uncharacterized membrane protein (UPF0127 family)
LTAGCGAQNGTNDGSALAATDRQGAGQEVPGRDSGLPVIDEHTGQPIKRAQIQVGGLPVTVELAETRETQQRGLMGRDSLPDDYGMLFVYDSERTLSFWMRNTKIPLDIAFIDANGIIVGIEQLEPRSEESVLSKSPAMYALEINQGWFSENSVTEGATIEF